MAASLHVAVLLATLAVPAVAGPRFIWHRAWGMSQDAKKGARGKSLSQVLGVGCTEDYCEYSKAHKCTLDCIVPQHGCRQFCIENGKRDARDYICKDGIVFGKGGSRGNPTCFPNGFPTTDAVPTGCCNYFQCSGTGRGKCDPREIFAKCQTESGSGRNSKLTGCLKRVNKDIDKLPSIFQKFLSHPGGDTSVALPDPSRRRGGVPPGGGGAGPAPSPGRRRSPRRRTSGGRRRTAGRRRSSRRRSSSRRRTSRRRSSRRRSPRRRSSPSPGPTPSGPSPSPNPIWVPSPPPGGMSYQECKKHCKNQCAKGDTACRGKCGQTCK